MRLILLLSLVFIAHNAPAAECRSERMLSFAEQLARLDPKIDLKLLDFDFFDGGGISLGYRYKVEPAYTNGLYARTDRWQIRTNAVPGSFDVHPGLELGLNAGVKLATEAKFIRFAKDPCEAMSMKPYSPLRAPLRADVALSDKFNVGDYFVFRGSAGFVASAEILGMLSSSFWGANLSASYLMEGFYQMHMVRLSQNKVRLKVLGHRGREFNATLGIGWNQEFEVFNVSALDNQLERLVNLNPIKIKVKRDTANIFMVDYLLDLSDREVASAFDQLIANAKSFRQIQLANPFKDQKDLSGMLLLDLSPLEDLFQKDRVDGNLGRVERNLRTTSTQHKHGWGIDLGNNIIGYEMDKETADSYMRVRRDDNSLDYYLLKSWSTKSEGRLFYSWSKASKRNGMRALFETDEKSAITKPINIVSYLYKKNNRLDSGDYSELKEDMLKSLPLEVFNAIPWQEWDAKAPRGFSNFGLRYDFVMAPEAINEIPELSAEEISRLFTTYTLSKGLKYRDYFSTSIRGPRSRVRRLSPRERFEKSLKSFSKMLSRLLDRDSSIGARIKQIDKLRKNFLFKESGLGFLMSLRPDLMDRMYQVEMNLSSNEGLIEFEYGQTRLSELYKKLLSIKAALDDDALDLLREAESLSRQY